MKINITEELRKDTLLSHVVLHSMSKTVAEELVKEGDTKKGIICDIKMTINGNDIDIRSFIDHWQSQFNKIVIRNAKDLINEKFDNVIDMLYDLKERVEPEIEKRLEDWEKENENK